MPPQVGPIKLPFSTALIWLVIKLLSEFVAESVNAHVIHELDKAGLDAGDLSSEVFVFFFLGAFGGEAAEDWGIGKVGLVHGVLSVITKIEGKFI